MKTAIIVWVTFLLIYFFGFKMGIKFSVEQFNNNYHCTPLKAL